jgi:hypothetical protein
MEVEGAHPPRTMSLNAAELKQLLQSKEESPESLFLELEKLVLVKRKLEKLVINQCSFSVWLIPPFRGDRLNERPLSWGTLWINDLECTSSWHESQE